MERLKADWEKAITQETTATAMTISSPINTNSHGANYDKLDLNNALFGMTLVELIKYAKETFGQTEEEAELHATYIQEKQEAIG